jgi:hypothetical protein
MCTVIYLPGEAGKPWFFSVRDEHRARPVAHLPQCLRTGDVDILAPIDPLGGGSWIGVNAFLDTIILFNGAFEKHLPQVAYRISRGLILRKLLETGTPLVEWAFLDLTDIEPFSLLVYTDDQLYRFTWDGLDKHRLLLNKNIPHIFSSVTLYDTAAIAHREKMFQNWYPESKCTNEAVLDFLQHRNDTQNGFLIERENGIQSQSISSIQYKENSVSFQYHELKTQRYVQTEINKFGCLACLTTWE